jgi:hypothetical protein
VRGHTAHTRKSEFVWHWARIEPISFARWFRRQWCWLASAPQLGIVKALSIGYLLTKLLFGVTPSNPVTLIAVTALLIAVVLVAALIPGL